MTPLELSHSKDMGNKTKKMMLELDSPSLVRSSRLTSDVPERASTTVDNPPDSKITCHTL